MVRLGLGEVHHRDGGQRHDRAPTPGVECGDKTPDAKPERGVDGIGLKVEAVAAGKENPPGGVCRAGLSIWPGTSRLDQGVGADRGRRRRLFAANKEKRTLSSKCPFAKG